MNNETRHEYKIKLRGDGVYDIYIDNVHMCSKGNITSAVKELETMMDEADEYILKDKK